MILYILQALSIIIILFFSLSEDKIIFRKKSSDKSNHNTFSFSKYAWNQFKKNKVALISLYILFLMIFIAIFAPQIANDKPLYAVYKGKKMYPALYDLPFGGGEQKYTIYDKKHWDEFGDSIRIEFNDMVKYDWKSLEYEKVIWAPIPYSPSTQDDLNRDYKSPLGEQKYKRPDEKIVDAPSQFRHHLGTDKLGRDLASGLIHGTRIALSVGLVSMGIASILGIFLGSIAGFFGDRGLKMRRIKYYFTLLGIFLGFFYSWRKYEIIEAFQNSSIYGWGQIILSIIIFFGVIILFRLISKLVPGNFFNKEINVPIDSFVSRGIELLNSIPRLLLIITVAAMQKDPSLYTVMIIIGITSWTGIARFTRAELLRIRSLEYISASNALGFSSSRTIFKHALPNALAPVFVSIAFGIASAILIESGLSFLGIGVPADAITWGGLLNLGRLYHEAWWLIIYPGIAIFITITIYNMIGEAARDALDPKLKS